MLGVLVHASFLSGAAIFFRLGESLWLLVVPVLFAISVLAYLLLNAYLERIDHHRVGKQMLAVDRQMDDHEANLLREAQDIASRMKSLVLIAGVMYLAYVFTLGWPVPEKMEG